MRDEKIQVSSDSSRLNPGRNWTWKIKGLYMDLGHLDTTGVTTGAYLTAGKACAGLSLTGGQVTTQSHFTDGILRAGLNYKFY